MRGKVPDALSVVIFQENTEKALVASEEEKPALAVANKEMLAPALEINDDILKLKSFLFVR